MAVRIRKLTLWRTRVEHRPGALADLLDPLAAAGADLSIVMGYRLPGEKQRAVIEVAPITSRRTGDAAAGAGLGPGGPPPCSSSATTGRGSRRGSRGPWPRVASTSPSWSPRSWESATPRSSGSTTRATSTRRPTASAPWWSPGRRGRGNPRWPEPDRAGYNRPDIRSGPMEGPATWAGIPRCRSRSHRGSGRCGRVTRQRSAWRGPPRAPGCPWKKERSPGE